jgi:peptide/nickel transport system substrate-binding protein
VPWAFGSPVAPARSNKSCDAVPLCWCRLQIVEIDLPGQTGVSIDAAAIADPLSAPRGPLPDGQSAQITATPWPGPIPQLRRKIKGRELAANFTASAAPRPLAAKARAAGHLSHDTVVAVNHIPSNSWRTFPSLPLARAAIGGALGALAIVLATPAARAAPAIAMHGAPALPDDFTAAPYANPDAPKGGRMIEGVLGTFDSLNPLIVQGLAVQTIRGYVIESLMARGYDEPFTLYGLLAQSVETDDARTFVTFTLDSAAHFSDGAPVTADDVVFSWQLLRDHGRPNHRTYYAKVEKTEILGPRTVRFDFSNANDRELPLILGLMPVLPKHAVDPATFENSTLAKPIGSGPYVVSAIDTGKSVSFKRDPNYWGRELPINRGLWNFDELRFDFYRDQNAYFEAFKAGLYDVRSESDPARWQVNYDFPAVRDGRVVKETFTNGLPKFSSDYVFNTRRAIFSDIRVRQAIALLFDFEWINRDFFFNLYRRSASFFDDSELSAYRRPADGRERALLAPFADAVQPDVLDGTWSPPVSDGSGRDRNKLRQALALFGDAGYELKGTVLRNRTTGAPLAFEIMVTNRDDERLALAFAGGLARAGIAAQVRLVDAVQYQQRLSTFDFDMIEYRWEQSLSPGNEQTFYWGSAAADQDGSRNYMGVKSPAVDALIAALLRARERTDFVAAVRALDRVLISGSYVVPLFYLPEQWVARRAAIRHPARTSLFGFLPDTWWREK